MIQDINEHEVNNIQHNIIMRFWGLFSMKLLEFWFHNQGSYSISLICSSYKILFLIEKDFVKIKIST